MVRRIVVTFLMVVAVVGVSPAVEAIENGEEGGYDRKYLTAMFYADWKGYQYTYLCAAVVVRPNWLLTASHCAAMVFDHSSDDTDPRMWPSIVLFGYQPQSRFDVEEVHFFSRGHDAEQPENYGDAALIKIAGSLSDAIVPNPSNSRRPGCYMGPEIYSETSESLIGEELLCLGPGGSPYIHIWDYRTKKITYGYLPVDYSGEKMFIVRESFNDDGQKVYTTCGDSGGPCFVENADGSLVLVGTASRNRTIHEVDGTTIERTAYLRTSYAASWMDSILPPASEQLPGQPEVVDITHRPFPFPQSERDQNDQSSPAPGAFESYSHFNISFNRGENAKWHQVQYSNNPEDPYPESSSWFKSDSITISLEPGRIYHIRVAAMTHCGIAISEEVTFAATVDPPKLELPIVTPPPQIELP